MNLSAFYFLFYRFLRAIFLLSIFYFLFSGVVFASPSGGVIDSTRKYAWSENIGWINFGCANCNVQITDSVVTGYAWSENFGWINLAPATAGVRNNGEGNLSGQAWGENLGWIDFDNVFINASGKFTGTANGAISGIINFDCLNCGVLTNWRPISARPAPALPPDQRMPSALVNLPRAPEDNFGILINQGAKYTSDPIVSLNLFGGLDAAKMMVSNFSDFRDATQETYRPAKNWNLCRGQEVICEKLRTNELTDYEFTVYAKFYAAWGASSGIVSDNIIYRPPFIRRITRILDPFVPEPPKIKPPETPFEELIPREAPFVFRGKWQLSPSEPIRKFVFAPLPGEFQRLTEKFPEVGNLFAEIGIERLGDIKRLRMTELRLPGLTARIGLPTIRIEPGKFAFPVGVPIAQLSPRDKNKIPSDIVFVRTSGELIDFDITLSLTEDGKPQQKINAIAGKPLKLVVRPEQPVEKVRGYLVFHSRKITQLEINELTSSQVNKLKLASPLTREPDNLKIPLNSLFASMFFAAPSFARAQNPVEVETRLVMIEFEYTDLDRDGIYTAEIQAPIVQGKYEIITVFDFTDPRLTEREIRLITVIDPEGYIYKKRDGMETRIPGAVVSLLWLNPETKEYELWPAEKFLQENPQITDITGKYSFLVPEGHYQLRVEAPGFLAYEGVPFSVRQGSGVHINVELKSEYQFLETIDWKIIFLAIILILLLYGFYRDKVRARLIKLTD